MSPEGKKYVPVRRTRNSIGKRIAALRNQKGMTQEDLAGAVAVKVGWDISRYTIKRIETGEREVTDIEIRRLATALGVNIQELFM